MAGDRDGHVIAGQQFAVVGGQAQHKVAGLGKARGRIRRRAIGEYHNPRPAYMAPCRCYRIGHAVIVDGAIQIRIRRQGNSLIRTSVDGWRHVARCQSLQGHLIDLAVVLIGIGVIVDRPGGNVDMDLARGRAARPGGEARGLYRVRRRDIQHLHQGAAFCHYGERCRGLADDQQIAGLRIDGDPFRIHHPDDRGIEARHDIVAGRRHAVEYPIGARVELVDLFV